MDIDPPKSFEPDEALALFAEPTSERYGLSDRVFFYLIITCRAIESFAAPAFTIDACLDMKPTGSQGCVVTPVGCVVRFVVHQHEFWIDTFQRLKLFAAAADEAGSDSHRWLVFDGDSANPSAWEGLLKAIGRVEHFGVIIQHADRLRLMYSQWLIERKRRDDERGF